MMQFIANYGFFLRFVLLTCVLSGLLFCPANAQEHPTEQEIMAALLFKFTSYVDWPEQPDQASEEFVICVLGDDVFFKELKAFSGQTLQDKVVAVRKSESLDDVGKCQMIFVGDDRQERLPAIVKRFGEVPLLTIGKSADFAANGGMINFTKRKGSIRFEINPLAAKRAGLTISSKLLRLADIVE